ncbi:hypothetical protein ABPG75_007293 [Micractinium tetrahymenae]
MAAVQPQPPPPAAKAPLLPLSLRPCPSSELVPLIHLDGTSSASSPSASGLEALLLAAQACQAGQALGEPAGSSMAGPAAAGAAAADAADAAAADAILGKHCGSRRSAGCQGQQDEAAEARTAAARLHVLNRLLGALLSTAAVGIPTSCVPSPQLSGGSNLSSSTLLLGNALQPEASERQTGAEEAARGALAAARMAAVLATLPPRDAAEWMAAKAFLARF